MFGSGIDTAITSAYEWLIENYEPDDEIFIFGFSRGAYTARSCLDLFPSADCFSAARRLASINFTNDTVAQESRPFGS